MKFLVVLLAVLLFRHWIGGNPVRDAVSFSGYKAWLLDLAALGALPAQWGFLACIGLPLALFLIMFSWTWGLLWGLLSLLILFYSMEVENVEEDLDVHLRWLRSLDEQDDLEDAKNRQEAVRSDIVASAFRGFYPAVFWFLIAGPAGVLAYALIRDYRQASDATDEETPLVERILYLAEWIPVRLTGLVFALIGDFTGTINEWIVSLADAEATPLTLDRYAVAAIGAADYEDTTVDGFILHAEDQVFQLRQLLDRTVWGWVGVAAIVAILGW